MRFEWMGLIVLCGSMSAAALPPPQVRFVDGSEAAALGGDDCTGGIVADDGTGEQGVTIVGTASGVVVDRVTPPSYPYRLTRACVCWFHQNQIGDTTVEFDLAVYDDDGPGGGPGTFLGAVPAIAENVPEDAPGRFYGYDIGALDLVVDSGSVFLGPRYDGIAEDSFAVCADVTPTTPRNFPALSLDGGVSFDELLIPDEFRAWLIRADGEPVVGQAVAVPTLGGLGVLVLVTALVAAGLWCLRGRR